MNIFKKSKNEIYNFFRINRWKQVYGEILQEKHRKIHFKDLKKEIIHLTIINASIFGFGDLLVQKTFSKEEFSTPRIALVTVEGGILNGIMLTPFYRILEIIYGRSNYATVKITLQKILTMQIVYLPISTFLFVFITTTASNMGITTSNHCEGNVMDIYFKAYFVSWLVWPIVDFFNFSFVPRKWRSCYDSVLDIGWSGYLSHMAHESK
eukprot:GHVL01042530.1.p1 GENE.GHVL01042530.1~~GHVL01042530.1.p1  ORF type:complete len:209 (-),score=31.98 GHVL01042530.1:57-683(-)